ncbi:UNKNOWN [Stylonychia lemnae]|uniref:Cadg domain containing protein n=1 Tax=Stylonychia lemnae TaxID=5949 RepID=A0A078A4W6_STYLE|nr:UNKNOWN [Stylonychia lemnae]|eukprot:CDW77305.1 UNKNOWN [Stylonychia lemnae]
MIMISFCNIFLVRNLGSDRNLMHEDLTYCFQQIPTYSYPQVLGGLNGFTEFNCITQDSTFSTLIIGGYSNSNDIVDQLNTPIMIKINQNSGSVIWSQQYQSTSSIVRPQTIQVCNIQQGSQNYIVGMSKSPEFAIFIMDFATGLLQKTLYEFNSDASFKQITRSPGGIYMDSSNKIYAVSTESDKVKVYSFVYDQAALTINPIIYINYGNALTKYVSVFTLLESDYSAIYFTGSYNQNPAIIKVNLQTGGSLLGFSLQASGSSAQQQMGRFSKFTQGLITNQIGCAQNLGTTVFDIAFVFITEIATIQTLSKSWYLTMTEATKCTDLRYSSSIAYYLLSQDGSARNLFGQLDTSASTTTLSMTQLQLSSTQSTLFSQNAFIDASGSFFYYVGSLTKISSHSYSQRLAFVMKFPQNNPLLPSNAVVSMTATYQSLFLLGKITTPISLTISSNSENVILKDPLSYTSSELILIDKQEVPPNFQTYQNIGTITPSSVQSQIYTVAEPALVINYADFTYSVSCQETLQWTYSSKLSNGSDLPNWIQFTQLSVGNGFQFTIQTNDNSTFGIYQILLIGLLNSLYSGQTTFQLTVNSLQSSTQTTTTTTTTPNPTTTTPIPTTQTTFSSNLISNRAPYFETKLQDQILIFYDEQYILRFPKVIEPDQDLFEIKVVNQLESKLPDFITYHSNELFIKPSLPDIGDYVIIIIVKDDNTTYPMQNQYLIKLKVQGRQKYRDIQKPNISLPYSNGEIPSYQSILGSKDISIIYLNTQGKLKLEFSQALLQNRNIQDLIRNYLDIQTTDGENQVKSWHAIETINDYNKIEIQIEFLNDKNISMGQIQDQLQVSVNLTQNSQLIQVFKLIPPQEQNLEFNSIINDITTNTISTVLYGSIGINMLIGTSLQLVWGMVNTLQLVSHTPLFSIPYTAEILIFLKAVFTVVTFDPFNSSQHLQKIFQLRPVDEYEDFNDRFEFLGYDNSNFIYLIGPPILLLIFNIGLILIFALIRLVKSSKLRKIDEYL